jgi:hypothetical protein
MNISAEEIKNIFDNLNDSKNIQIFNKIVDNIGIHGIMELCEIAKYDKDTTDNIVIKSIKRILNNYNNVSITEYVFGCRHIESKEYSWDRAFVIAKTKNSKFITLAYFNDGIDYIRKTKSYNEAIKEYNTYIKLGFIPMSIKDIEETSGIIIDKNTITNLKNKNNNKKFFNIILVGTLIGIVTKKLFF